MIRHGPLDRFAHRLALHSHAFRKFCFARECERNRRAFDRHREHVFIAGMARSGSTALLNALHASGSFAATTYALMPFVLAPSLARVLGRLASPATLPVERRHGDSLRVDRQSPEALDGIFWNTYLPQDDGLLRPREIPRSVLRGYAMFIENTMQHYGRRRYLSKMNQGIGLLPDLVAWFDRALFLVPFRQPLQQAASLLRQHRVFTQVDGYERRYLAWLEHREFGAGHRAFAGDGSTPPPAYPPTSLNYWLEQWQAGYGYLARLAGAEPRVLPLAYERLAASPRDWDRLSCRLGVAIDATTFVDRNDAQLDGGDADPALLASCGDLYRRLAALGAERTC